jgi:TRAP-type mannitol/chloroaromatic compound transport system permease small subunit
MTRNVLEGICAIVDSLSAAARFAAAGLALALIGCTLFEVVMRYFLSSPSIWAFDVAYMLNGSVFLLAVAAALQFGTHVRVDFLSSRFPVRIRNVIDAVFFLLPASISIGLLMEAAFNRTVRAIQTGETEAVSPWAPLMWPFYLVITVGLSLLFLQCIAQGLRSLIAALNQDDGSVNG